MSTTLPLRASMVSGGEFSHSTAPESEGAAPSTGRASVVKLGFAFIIMAGLSPAAAGFADIIAGPLFMTTLGSVGLAFIIMAGFSLPGAELAAVIAGPSVMTTEDRGAGTGVGCK